MVPGLFHGQLCHLVYDPLKVGRAYRVYVRIGRRIHKIDSVRDPILAGKFDGVQVVAQGAAKRQAVAFDPLQKLGVHRRRVLDVAFVKRPGRVVLHDVNVLLPNAVAAEIFLEFHRRLQGHTKIAGLLVGMEELGRRVHLVYILPAAAVEGLEERRKTNVIENAVPGEGVSRFRMEWSVVPGGWCLWGRSTVLGIATPSLVPRAKLKNLSSALHQKGLLMMIDPERAAFLR